MASLLFLSEAIQLISFTTIEGVFFGINFSLYFLCTQLFYRQYSKAPVGERRNIVYSFLYNSLMMFMAALELGTDSRWMQLAYINHGGINGEPIEFEVKWQSTFSALTLLGILPSFVIGILSPLMQASNVWRTWIIWAISPYKLVVVIFPLFLLVAGVALDIYNEVNSFTATQNEIQDVVGTTLAALNVTFNVLVTLLLVGRIIVVRRRHIRLIGTTSENAIKYTSIIAMLIESYALDSVWSMASMISYALATEGNNGSVWEIFDGPSNQITVIAFLLVTYRVLLNRAWTPETERQLSAMQWNRGGTEDSTDSTV